MHRSRNRSKRPRKRTYLSHSLTHSHTHTHTSTHTYTHTSTHLQVKPHDDNDKDNKKHSSGRTRGLSIQQFGWQWSSSSPPKKQKVWRSKFSLKFKVEWSLLNRLRRRFPWTLLPSKSFPVCRTIRELTNVGELFPHRVRGFRSTFPEEVDGGAFLRSASETMFERYGGLQVRIFETVSWHEE